MTIDLKLKDGVLNKIDSYLDTVTQYDYYNSWQNPVQTMTFEFSTDDDKKIECRFTDICEDYSNFTYIADFFYKKDFSETTIKEFIDCFSEYVNVTPKYPPRNKTKHWMWTEVSPFEEEEK